MRHTEGHCRPKVICVSYTNNTCKGDTSPKHSGCRRARGHGCSGGMSFKLKAVQQHDEMSFHFRSAHPSSSSKNIADCSPSHSRQGGRTSCSLL
ncbi:hypothetical protein PISMIDRAFT_686369, partial [Pisolithus microcarpus 441]